MPPWRIIDVLERAETGPVCFEKDFDTKILVPNIQRVVKEYDIKYHPETVISADDSLADDLWKAAWDLYLTVGTYCTSTYRRMLFSESEIKEALDCYVDTVRLGYGKDSREWSSRKVEDPKRPGCFFSPIGVRCSEDVFADLTMCYMQEPLADAVSTPILEEVEGRQIGTGPPSEIQGATVHAMRTREAARRVGRPGIAWTGTGTALTDTAQIATSDPSWGMRRTDIRLVPIVSELKVNNDILNKMLHFHQGGYLVAALSGPLCGAYAGVEGTAVVGVASHIQGLMVSQGYFMSYFPIDMRYLANTTREMLWLVSSCYQALARNTRLVSGSAGMAIAGPCTEMVMYESAAHGITSAVSGASVLWEIASASNKHKERTTPMEARIACESGIAATQMQMKRETANELVKDILKEYENLIPKAPLGKTFRECYDVARKKPSQEHLDVYNKIKRELGDMGLKYSY